MSANFVPFFIKKIEKTYCEANVHKNFNLRNSSEKAEFKKKSLYSDILRFTRFLLILLTTIINISIGGNLLNKNGSWANSSPFIKVGRNNKKKMHVSIERTKGYSHTQTWRELLFLFFGFYCLARPFYFDYSISFTPIYATLISYTSYNWS